jgi:hypothetical protein
MGQSLRSTDRVSRLVLDSIVPHDNLDPLELAGITRTADVLRMVCKENGCTTDPAQDLSEVVRSHHDGPELYDTLTSLSVGKPRLTDIPAALHDAARGDDTALDTIVAAERQNQAAESDELSQGCTRARCAMICTGRGDTPPHRWPAGLRPPARR